MKKNMFLRIVFYAAGLLILALGIILNTKSGLGVSPIISVAYSIATIGGFNFGNITFLLYSAFVVVEIVLHIFRNQRYSREANGAIAPAARRDLKLVLLMDLLQLPLSLVFTRFMNLFPRCCQLRPTICYPDFWFLPPESSLPASVPQCL